MPLELDWPQVALRLALALLAGFLIGLNRGEHGKPADLRTNIFVCLAAALAMILANLLLSTTGKAAASFVQIDPMRLPLGILTGIGFIGAGTIFKNGNLVEGVTTAATVWFVTVIGLCFGSGQLVLGLAALSLALIVLFILGALEKILPETHRGTIVILCDPDAPTPPTQAHLRDIILKANLVITASGLTLNNRGLPQLLRCDVQTRQPKRDCTPPAVLAQLAATPGVKSVRWNS